VVRDGIDVTLKTDANGEVHLGPLSDVSVLRVDVEQGQSQTFKLHRVDAFVFPSSVTATASEAVQAVLPLSRGSASGGPLLRCEARLIDAGVTRNDFFHCMSVRDDRFVVVSGLPAGRYTLTLKRTRRVGDDSFGSSVSITVVRGDAVVDQGGGFEAVLGASLDVSRPRLQCEPLAVGDVWVDTTREHLMVRVAASQRIDDRNVCVHVAVSHFDLHGTLGSTLCPQVTSTTRVVGRSSPQSQYLSCRSLGDELKYILDRKEQKKFPGNTLARPSLLLNPWAIGMSSVCCRAAIVCSVDGAVVRCRSQMVWCWVSCCAVPYCVGRRGI
jgi:hypothetical protein